MCQKNNDKEVYDCAWEYLLNNTPEEVTKDVIGSYLSVPNGGCKDLSCVYRRLLLSAKNGNMIDGVIMGVLGGDFERLGDVLNGFDAKWVSGEYSGNLGNLIDYICQELKLDERYKYENLNQNSRWFGYCRTIISGAEFISQFENYQDFSRWVNAFPKDERSMAALPLLIEKEVYGLGFTLACDFVKELGFHDYGKPDVHIIEIFKSVGLVAQNASVYEVFKAISRVARNSDSIRNSDSSATAYEVDKLFWLIGSGYFYNHTDIGNNGRIGGMRNDFIGYFNAKCPHDAAR